MPDEVNTGDAAAEQIDELNQTGDNPAAEGNDDIQAQLAAQKAKAENEVAKRQALEQQIEDMKNQQLLLQANAPQQPQGPQDIFAQQGFEDEDPVRVRDVRQYLAQQGSQIMTGLQFQTFISSNPDFSDIVGTMGSRGLVPAAPLKELIKNNPHLQGLDIAVAQNPGYAPIAYKLAKDHIELTELRAKASTFEEHQKQLEIANKTTPLSPAAVSGAPTESAIESATDEQFDQLDQQVMSGEFG